MHDWNSGQILVLVWQEQMNGIWILWVAYRSQRSNKPGGGGGGTSILTDGGPTCRWTGYDFAIITIDTGYLNRPNWLLADYSVYHRVASQPTMFMTGPRSRHQWRRVRDATDFYECMMIHSRIESQGMHMKVFSKIKVYCDRVYFLCAERFETGSGFHPPPPPPPGNKPTCVLMIYLKTLWNLKSGSCPKSPRVGSMPFGVNLDMWNVYPKYTTACRDLRFTP